MTPPDRDPTAEAAPRPTANRDGFTDSGGNHMDYETGLREAARYVRHNADVTFIADLMRELSPEDILEWLVYPDTGMFELEAHRG